MNFRTFPLPVMLTAAIALLLYGAAARPNPAPSEGFTAAQVTNGQLVYVQYCLRCHGAKLEGASGPPLAGPRFGASLAVGKMTTPALFTFISGSMPMNAPGSLTDRQYLDVLAFVLRRNGFAPGTHPLTKAGLARVAMFPFPASSTAAVAMAAASTGPGVPASANVALDNSAMQSAPSTPKDWPLPGRTYANWRYSPLAQIDAANVGSLKLAAVVHTGIYESFETTPIVVDGVMYITTPVKDEQMKIIALDAATGTRFWTASRPIGPHKVCCGPNNRGAAVGYGNVYVATLDDHLVALDARTGAERWETQVADPSVGYSESLAPQIYDGKVIVGSAGGEWALRGFVAAYDAYTGKQLWRWYSTDPKTFAGNSWKTGGGTVWTTPAIDTERNLVIFGTGNPNPDLNGASRAGDNLYTDSIVALNVRTGKLRWYYQEVKHDLWDYDATSNVVLFDVHDGGKTIPAAAQAGKVGWLYIVDRRNGKLIRRSTAFVTQNKNMFSKKTVLPGANGGSEWSPPAYSPQTHDEYLLGINQSMDFTQSRPGDHPGFMRTGSVFTNTKKPKVQTGTFTAVDVETGKIAWQHVTPKPMIGGALATGGGLVFVGDGTGAFAAYDAKNGDKLWSYAFPGGVNAPAVSYEVNGTQYVAVAAGGNFQLDYKRGDEVGIFKLAR